MGVAVWSASRNNDNNAYAVKNDGDREWNNVNKRNLAARPDSLLKRFFVNLNNKPEKYILSKIYLCYKVKEFFSFLTAKELVESSAVEKNQHSH